MKRKRPYIVNDVTGITNMTEVNADLKRKCILSERHKDGCVSCPPTCAHFITMHGLSGKGGRTAAANLPEDYRYVTLANSPARTEQAKNYAMLAQYVATFKRMFDEDGERIKSLYLYSESPGTGKTTSAAALINAWLVEHYLGSLQRNRQPLQQPAMFLDVNEYQTKYNLATMTNDDAELDEVKRTMRRCMSVPFLVMDDVGIRSASESFKSIVHGIINARTTGNKPTIYTSNLPIEEMARVFDRRLYDRMRDQCAELEFGGTSKRGRR